MRIIDPNSLGSSLPTQNGRTNGVNSVNGTARNGATSKTTGSDGDRVELSGFSGEVNRVMQADASSRAQRVQQLAAAVRSGTYKVDSAELSKTLADHMIASATVQSRP